MMAQVASTMTILKSKEETELVFEYPCRACEIMLSLTIDNKTYLITDSTFTVDIIDVEKKSIHSQIDLAGGMVRCAVVVGDFIILGVEDADNENGPGNILCYGVESLEKVGEETTGDHVTPFCLKALSSNPNQIMVGLSNGCIQLFSIHKQSNKPLSIASAAISAAP